MRCFLEALEAVEAGQMGDALVVSCRKTLSLLLLLA
jgi:hypothetical protein